MVTNGQVLEDLLTEALKTGEIPYQATLTAAKELDWYQEEVKGDQQLNLALAGIDMFITDLEALERGAKEVQRRSAAAVR